MGAQFLPSLNKNSCQVHVCLLFLIECVHLLCPHCTVGRVLRGLTFIFPGGLVWFSPWERKPLTHSSVSGGGVLKFMSMLLLTLFGLTILVNIVSSLGKDDAADHLISVVTRSTESDDLQGTLAPEGLGSISSCHWCLLEPLSLITTP